MKNLLLSLVLLAFVVSCNLVGVVEAPCVDCPPDPTDTIVVTPPDTVAPIILPDTCVSYSPIDTPAFVQGWIQLDNPINVQGWVLNVGGANDPAPFQETVLPGEEALLPERLEALFGSYLPQYPAEAFARADARRISLILRGTDNNTALQLKAWIRADGAKWFFAFGRRTFYHGGAIDLPTWLDLAKKYPSVVGWNLRDAGFDSLGENSAMIAIVDTCKLCEGCRSDFRFNNFPPSDSIEGAFDDAHWSSLQNAAPVGGYGRGVAGELLFEGDPIGVLRKSGVIDSRGYCLTEERLLQLLAGGFPVITDL